ncbi:MAG: HAD-IA family hydrolase [Clostridiales Family XIII bacterium]|jgi:pyrophosphatase PpaX|nr:HAD-IA family hydrolase [Clostridiales Family XIII bacterium]
MNYKDYKGIDTIILDFDGTIMDTNELILESWTYAIEKLTGEPADRHAVQSYFGETIEVTVPKLIPNHPYEESVATYRSYQYDNFLDNIRPFAGVREALPLFKEKDFKLALVTSRLTNSTMMALDHFELTEYFDVIITADDTKIHKPDPTPVFMALDKVGSTADRALMVGDSTFDIEAAKNAGAISVLVSYSVALPEEKREAVAPDLIIDNIMDLFDLLP